MTEQPLTLTADGLGLADVLSVARERRPVHLSPDAAGGMSATLEWVREAVEAIGKEADPKPIYGINTGFGSLAGRHAYPTEEHTIELLRRLVLSTAAGDGRPLDEEVVRAAMLIRAASLARGFSGVRPEVVETLLQMLNRGVAPAIPEYGSLGASGDLIPLAHLALVATRSPSQEDDPRDSGRAFLDGEVVSGEEAMERAGLPRIVLGPKEGLAFINGTAFSAALAALALADAENLVASSEVVLAMTTEALFGFYDAFLEDIHAARGQRGQIESAANVRALLEGSAFIEGSRERDPSKQPPQDAYSVRCAPQVLGAARDTIRFVRDIVERELSAATDNPLIFPSLPRPLKAVSGGNFHGEYLAFVSDFKTLAPPDSVDSIPPSANQEDHVAMSMNAGRHVRQVVRNAEGVVAVELIAAAQALELRLRQDGRRLEELAPATQRVLEILRTHEAVQGRNLDYIEKDEVLYPRLEAAIDLVHSGRIAQVPMRR